MIKTLFKKIWKILTLTASLTAFILPQNTVLFTFGDVDFENGTLMVMMENSNPVHAFNINISGIQIDSIQGGIAEENGFDISFDGSHGHDIHGSVMGNTPIQPGYHELLEISFTALYELICIYRGHSQGNGNVELDVELDACIDTVFEEDEIGFFRDIMNGYLEEYLEFIQTYDEEVRSYITVEAADDLDFGDDIGLLSYDGLINYGDCSDETGEILLGADIWYGGPITIPAYRSIDLCDEGGFQLPGFTEDEPVVIHVWDASEGIEYVMDITSRIEFSWNTGHTVIGSMDFDAIQAIAGDVDADMDITVTDVVMVVAAILETAEFTPHQFSLADINMDARLDVLDLIYIIDFIIYDENRN